MGEFYVYALLDPRVEEKIEYVIDGYKIYMNYKPFYIGKGKKSRLNSHFSNFSLKKNTYKNNKILKIIEEGYKLISTKLIENLEEDKSYDLEIKIISLIGLDNLTNKNNGGIGQSSSSMMGDKNPMYGKHPIAWNKGIRGILKNKYSGMKLEEILGEDKSKEVKKKQSEKRKGKSWEEYFGKDKSDQIKMDRFLKRGTYKHSEETKNKIKEKITTENILKRQIIIIENRKKKFDDDFEKNKMDIKKMLDLGFNENEIIKRITGVSRYKIKKMIYLIKNNLTSDFYFKINNI